MEELRIFLSNKLRNEGFSNGVKLTKENYEILAPLSFSSNPIKFPENLAEKMEKEEILAICYHELAHTKHRHWLKKIILFFLIFIPSTLLGSFILEIPISSASGTLLSTVVAFVVLLLIARFHRNLENEADEYASSKIGPEIFLTALKKHDRWIEEIDKSKIPFSEGVTNLPFIKKVLNWLQSFAHPSLERRKKNLMEEFKDT